MTKCYVLMLEYWNAGPNASNLFAIFLGLHSRSRDFARRRRSSLLVFTETDRLYTA